MKIEGGDQLWFSAFFVFQPLCHQHKRGALMT